MRFADRRDAGRRLADLLDRPRQGTPIVIGLARGGLVIAAEVAGRLRAPLDVLVVRKIGCPWQPELGVGALVEGGIVVRDEALIRELGIETAELEAVIDRERHELDRRVRRYRAGRAPIDVAGAEVIIVDDGLATGGTARAAIADVRARGARRIVLAVPIAPRDTVRALAREVDEIVVVATPDWFGAIGEWYADFVQTSDEEVVALLAGEGASQGRSSPTSSDRVRADPRSPSAAFVRAEQAE